MKIALSLFFLSLLAISEKTCKHKKETLVSNCFKGRLEVKANCMNYTISVVEGTVDTTMVEPLWTDESTGKTYKNAFGLGSRCDFPTTINQGDEFYFYIDNTAVQNCAVCMMYYPTPRKKLNIRVVKTPCPK